MDIDPPHRKPSGYKRPPTASQFVKGRSGNPRGRPKGAKATPPYDAVLGQMVTIREDGVKRRVTAAEAFLLQITRKGLEGDAAAARAAMLAIEEARHKRIVTSGPSALTIVRVAVKPGSVNIALAPLLMAVKQDRYRPTARMRIEPWLVEAALARLDDKRLTPEQQAIVVGATRIPKKVRWPHWWTVLPE